MTVELEPRHIIKRDGSIRDFDADKIVVLDKGRVVEEGTHQELTALRGTYYKLVKNQLELGN